MSKLTENDIELMAINELQALGWDYRYGADIEPNGTTPLRTYSEVLLKEQVEHALQRLNPQLSDSDKAQIWRQINDTTSPDMLANNRRFHQLLTQGVTLERHINGETRGEVVRLLDFDDVSANECWAVNQVTIKQGGQERRPDIILYINGFPLVVIELKNAVNENATVASAFHQIQTYQAQLSNLYTFNAFNVISDGLEARAGTLSANLSRYMTWKSHNGQTEAKRTEPQLNVLIKGLLNPVTLLDMIRHFIVFEDMKHESADGTVTVKPVKKMAAYHQYYAVNAAVLSTLRAVGQNLPHTASGQAVTIATQGRPNAIADVKQGDKKAGVVWHTQGSGKSLSMVFYTGKIVLALDNPTIVVVTDRNDLDDQLFGTFSAAKELLRQEPKQANTREELKSLLKVKSGGIVFTTINKFQPNDNQSVYEQLSERHNIVVIADEAHRSQYGFSAKEVDIKDEDGNITGKRTVYGFAKYMRDALPNATYLGFTGTPIESHDVNTPAVFGNYVDIYDISQAVDDGATVRIFYESRLAKIHLDEQGRELIRQLDEELEEQDEIAPSQAEKRKWARVETIVGSSERIKEVAKDIVQHFEARLQANAGQGKGMIVAMSRRIAVDLYHEIVAIKPEWHSDELKAGAIKVVMTSSASDGAEMAKHHTSKGDRQKLALRMKDEDDPLKLVIVRDMWLTGFDAPCMHTLYIDKPMKGHNLMQAIARVNRVHGDKTGGLVVDYLGIAADLKNALSFYASAGGRGEPALLQDEAVLVLREKMEVLEDMLHGFDVAEYFTADTARKLAIILEAEDFILGLDQGKGKIRFLTAVLAASKAFALAVPHDTAMEYAPLLAFYQAVKARLAKFTAGTGGQNIQDDLEQRVRQTIDQALVSESVVDIFDAAGIQKPDISILSDEFMEEMRGYQHKNVALETLKKLLNDEIKVRSRKSFTEGKKLTEMLDNAIKGYQNKVLTAAEVIDELIKLAKEIQASDQLAQDMNLTEFEFAFYSAVAVNDSAKELMGKEKLRELAVVLTNQIRNSVTVDWWNREDAKAKIRVMVKRLLKKYGYPPDMEKLATETVLKQAEMMAEESIGTIRC